MSQNQSYFWQTTRHNVYLKRSAKWHMALALMVVLTFGTICAAEAQPDGEDNAVIKSGIQNDLDMPVDMNKPTDLSNIADKQKESTERSKSKGNFIDAFTASISVILLTELGDKTFFIAAIMAMRHPRLIVFGGAIAALALMTVLSCVFGMAANFIPKIYTYYISTALFLIFGLKMLYDGYKMKPTDAQEELEEVQTDLRKREDELMRKASRKYEDAEAKRKNSNSDKEDASEQALIHGRNNSVSVSIAAAAATSNGDSDMQHRQRKQRSHNNNNTLSNSKQNSCDKAGNDDEAERDQHESEVFLKEGGRIVEQLKMKTYHSSPAHSAASSAQTEQTNSMAASTTTVDAAQQAGHPTDPSAGGESLEPRAPLAGHDSMHSLNGSLNGEQAGPANGALKARLDRDVNAALVNDAESGRRRPQKRGATYFTMRILAQAFTMTFLAEWGDRSQLTTIILAASKDVYGVIAGGIIGHCICTGLAVIGGRLVASKISVRTVTIVGGIVFIGFAIYAVAMPPDDI